MSTWWIVYLGLASIPVALGTALLARTLRRHNHPERFVWTLGLLLSICLPVALLLSLGGGGATVADGILGTADRVAQSTSGALGVPRFEALPLAPGIDLTLQLVWILSSVLLGGWLLASLAGIRRIRARTTEAVLHGRPVRVSTELGPAVVGVVRPEILVPEWIRTVPDAEARWIVRHEEQHILAGDPLLLLAVHLSRAVMPWNPAVWYLSARLLEGIEIDCDRRVLDSAPDAAAYGRTLLSAAVRQPHPGLRAIAAFALRNRNLERRIETMTSPTRRFGLRGAFAALVAVALPVGACAVPMPTNLNTGNVPQADIPVEGADEEPQFTPFEVPPTVTNVPEVQRKLVEEYPPLLREAGISGTARIYFFIGEDGEVKDVRVDESSGHDELDLAALRVAQMMQFTPARSQGDPVAIWVSFPITFMTRDGGGDGGGA